MKKKLLSIVAILTVLHVSAQVGINTPSPSATLDVFSKGENTTFRTTNNNATPVETFTILNNGNVGVNNSAPAVPVHFKLNSSPTISAYTIAGQATDATGFISEQSLGAATTNIFNTQNLFQGIYSYSDGDSKANNVVTINAVSNGANYSATSALNTIAENQGTVQSLVSTNVSGVNSGTVSDYRGVNVALKGNSGTIDSTTGIFIGDLVIGNQTNTPYSLQSTDIGAGMWHQGKASFGSYDVNTSNNTTQLTTSSFAVDISPDQSGILSGFSNVQNTIVMGSSFLGANAGKTFNLPAPANCKGRKYTIIVLGTSTVKVASDASALIYHMTTSGYKGEKTYTLQKGSRDYISDGINWYVTAGTTERDATSGQTPN